MGPEGEGGRGREMEMRLRFWGRVGVIEKEKMKNNLFSKHLGNDHPLPSEFQNLGYY